VDFKTIEGNVAFIDIRAGTDNWGPFEFDFTSGIPTGASVTSVDVAVYVGNVDASSDLSTFTDIAALTVETNYSPLEDNVYGLKFQHPGSAYSGTTSTVVFTVTTDSNGIYPFFFYPVKFF
jgi:hypothetical protein